MPILLSGSASADQAVRFRCTYDLSYKRNAADSTAAYTSKNLQDNIQVDYSRAKLIYDMKALDAQISNDEVFAATGPKSTIKLDRKTLAYTSSENDALRTGDLYRKSGTCEIDASTPITASDLPAIKATNSKSYELFTKTFKGCRFLDRMKVTIVRDRGGQRDYSIELGGAVECTALDRVTVDPAIRPKEGDLVRVSGNIRNVGLRILVLDDCSIGPP